jgi:Tol biopolymer transport system component
MRVPSLSAALALAVVLAGTAGAGGVSSAAFNGRIAFASSRDGGYDVYAMNPDASDQRRLTTAAQTDIEPAWSPDGRRIAFTSNRDGNDEIYVMRADGVAQTRLTTNATTDRTPTWSAGGRDLAFTSERDGNTDIYVMSEDGSGQRRLTTSALPDANPTWSPDGARIAFQSTRDGNDEIYTMNVDGSGQTRLTTAAGADVSPSWSPDGKAIAFASNRDGNFEIYVMGADGSEQTRLTRNLDIDLDPAWSPNGALIAYTTNRDGNYEIYSIDANGGTATRLTTNGAEDTTADWQPLAEPPPPADAVKRARFRGNWRESAYRGTLEVLGRVGQPAVLTLALRQGRRVWLNSTLPLPAGSFERSVPLPRGLLPGTYLLDIGVVGSPSEKPTQRKNVLLRAPLEGVVSKAWVSAVLGGLPAHRFPGTTSLVAAHFRFASLPRPGRPVSVAWYDPAGRLARSIRKLRAASVVSFLATRNRTPMLPGVWQVVVRAGGTVAQRVSYRIG